MKCMHVLVVVPNRWSYLTSSLDGDGAFGFELSRYFVSSLNNSTRQPVMGEPCVNDNHNIAEYQIRCLCQGDMKLDL